MAQGIFNENMPGRSECAFQSYCGSEPIHNLATEGDIWGYRPTSTFCLRNMEVIRYHIDLMESDQAIKKIFERWVYGNKN